MSQTFVSRLVLASVGLAALVGCGGSDTATPVPPTTLVTASSSVAVEKTPPITGDLLLLDFGLRTDAASGTCRGGDEFPNIRFGAHVTAKNETGQLLAEGDIGDGMLVDAHGTVADNLIVKCKFPVKIPRLPVSALYQFEVDPRVGPRTYTHAQLQGEGWQVHLKIGTNG